MLGPISLLAVSSIDLLSIITMLFFLGIGLILNFFFFKNPDYLVYVNIFLFYTIIAVLIYWSNIMLFSNNYGCTGGDFGGTDDVYFFEEATNGGLSHRGDRGIFMHSFSKMLEVFHIAISIFKVTKVIDLLFLNILFQAFIPLFVKRIKFNFTSDNKAAMLAFRLVLISPFIMQHSLVLVRDGIVATTFIGALFFYIEKKHLLLVVFLLITFYLRIVSGLMLVGFIFLYINFEISRWRVLLYVFLTLFILTFFSPVIMKNLNAIGLFESGIFRSAYFDYIKGRASADSGAVLIYGLPAYLRIPLGTTYFIGTPFFNISSLNYSNIIYLWSSLSVAYSALFLFTVVFYIRAFAVKRNEILFPLLFGFTFIAMLLSQLSIEVRHKTMIMPLYFIIIGISYYRPTTKLTKRISVSISIALLFLQLLANIYKHLR